MRYELYKKLISKPSFEQKEPPVIVFIDNCELLFRIDTKSKECAKSKRSQPETPVFNETLVAAEKFFDHLSDLFVELGDPDSNWTELAADKKTAFIHSYKAIETALGLVDFSEHEDRVERTLTSTGFGATDVREMINLGRTFLEILKTPENHYLGRYLFLRLFPNDQEFVDESLFDFDFQSPVSLFECISRAGYVPSNNDSEHLVTVFKAIEYGLGLSDESEHEDRVKLAIFGSYQGTAYLDDPAYVRELLNLGYALLPHINNPQTKELGREMFSSFFSNSHACPEGELVILKDACFKGQNALQRFVWGMVGEMYAKLDKTNIYGDYHRHLLPALPILLGQPRETVTDTYGYSKLRELKFHDTKEQLAVFQEELQGTLQTHLKEMIYFLSKIMDAKQVDKSELELMNDGNVIFMMLYEQDLIEFCTEGDSEAIAVKDQSGEYYIRINSDVFQTGEQEDGTQVMTHLRALGGCLEDASDQKMLAYEAVLVDLLGVLNKLSLGLRFELETPAIRDQRSEFAVKQERVLILEGLDGVTAHDQLKALKCYRAEMEMGASGANETFGALMQYQIGNRPALRTRLDWDGCSPLATDKIQLLLKAGMLDDELLSYCEQLTVEELSAVLTPELMEECEIENHLGLYQLLFNVKIIKTLGEAYANIAMPLLGDDRGLVHFIDETGQTDVLKLLLDTDVVEALGKTTAVRVLNLKDGQTKTPLLAALQKGAVDCFEMLLDPDVLRVLGEGVVVGLIATPQYLFQTQSGLFRLSLIHLAARHGYKAFFDIILKPSSIQSLGKSRVVFLFTNKFMGCSPLHDGAEVGQPAIFEALLDPIVMEALGKETVLEIVNEYDLILRTPLDVAISKGNLDILKLFLTPAVIKFLGKEVIINSLTKKDFFGKTAIDCDLNNFYKILLDPIVIEALGKDFVLKFINAKGAKGRTPLLEELEEGRSDILELLLVPGVVRALGEETVTDLIDQKYRFELSHGVQVSDSLIAYAVSNGNKAFLKLILNRTTIQSLGKDRVARLFKINLKGGSFFHTAASFGQPAIFEAFLDPAVIQELGRETIVEIMTEVCCGKTPLHESAENGHAGILKVFLDPIVIEALGKDSVIKIINAKGPKGRTPLHVAVENGYSGMFEVLLDPIVIEALGKAAVVELLTVCDQDTFAATPLHLAVKHQHPDCLKALLNPTVMDALGAAAVNEILKTRAQGRYEATIFHFAAVKNQVAFLRQLLDKEVVQLLSKEAVAEILTMTDMSDQKRTMFHWAALRGHVDSLQVMLDPGVVDVLGADTVTEVLATRDESLEASTLFHLAESKHHKQFADELLRPQSVKVLGIENVLALLNVQDSHNRKLADLSDTGRVYGVLFGRSRYAALMKEISSLNSVASSA